MEQLGIILRLIWYRRNLSVENFKMVFGVAVKMNQFIEAKKGSGYIFYHDGKMEQYESPWVVLPGDD